MSALGTDSAEHEVVFPEGARVVIGWAGATDTGKHRDHNEDSYLTRVPVFAVADGMGGHSAGDFASARVVARLAELGHGEPIEPDEIDAALSRATDDILPVSEVSARGVGTTVTGVALSRWEGRPYWLAFNVGDSRCYLLRDGELSRLTVDHSIVQQMVDAGLITAEQAESHPDSNVITRAIGFEPDPEADRVLLPPLPGTRILICSDGLTKELNDAAIAEELGAGRDAHETVGHLMDRALGSEARDNISVIVVDVLEAHGLPEYPAADDSSLADTGEIDVLNDDTVSIAVRSSEDPARGTAAP